MSSPTGASLKTSSPTRRPPSKISSSSPRSSNSMTLEIAVETPLQDDVRAMVAALNDYLIPLTPREFQFQLTVEQMAEPAVTLFVARDAGRPVGMGGLKDHG